jgi:hypothetical protein
MKRQGIADKYKVGLFRPPGGGNIKKARRAVAGRESSKEAGIAVFITIITRVLANIHVMLSNTT